MSFTFITHFPNTAFLFPGQGSQQVGMGKALAEAYPTASATFAEADEILGFGLSKLCFDGPEEALTDTINAQPALLTTCVATLRAIASEFGQDKWPDKPASTSQQTLVAGHSMGEYSALVAAGSLQFADGLRLVRQRGHLMKEAGSRLPGLMAAVLGLDEAQVATICRTAISNGGVAQVANDNCPGQVVISGDKVGMEKAMAALSAAGAKKVVPLAVSIAAHSPLMQPAAEGLAAAIAQVTISTPIVPVIGNTTAALLSTPTELRNELNAQLTGSVRWTASMQTALAAGITRVIEIGPGEVLSGLMKRIERSAERVTVNDPASVQALVQ